MRLRPLWLLLLALAPAGGTLEGACRSDGWGCLSGPSLSVIYITKRPGGYDVLFESLAQQTSTDYELICIDDLPGGRQESAVRYALSKGLPLAAMVPSKEKVRGKRFGQCNAINSGLALSRGAFITVVQDNVWLPPTFVERTIVFFQTHPRDVLLSYPERRLAPPPGRLSRELMGSHTTMAVFDPAVTASPEADGWEVLDFNNTMTPDIFGHTREDRAAKTSWFECAACTASWELYAALNGLDEALDVGDDAQEANVKDRAAAVAKQRREAGAEVHGMGELWVDLGSVVELIDHHSFEADETWARFERDTNVHRWRAIADLIELGEYPTAAPNAFNLAAVRDGPAAQAWRDAVRAGRMDLGGGIVMGVDWDKLPKNDLSDHEMQQVKLVMGGRFGYKPDILVVHAMPDAHFDAWNDGLSAALRQMRRHFHITFMGVSHLRVEEQPQIDFKMRNTFHFFLGIGRFFGPVDYFIRQYNDAVNPQLEAKGQQRVRMGMIVQGGLDVPDGDGADIYEVIIYPTPFQASRARQEVPSLNVFSALGISEHALKDCKAKGGGLSFGVVGALEPEGRLELLLDKWGGRRVVGNFGHFSSEEIARELREGGVAVVDGFSTAMRKDVYEHADMVYFPMSEEGGGEMELLEALSCGAQVEVEQDNRKLQSMLKWEGGAPNEMKYAEDLVASLWTVLVKGASK